MPEISLVGVLTVSMQGSVCKDIAAKQQSPISRRALPCKDN